MSTQNPPAPAISDVVAPSGSALSATATPLPPWTTPMISGALVRISRSSALDKTLLLFQYNPETLTRSLTPNYYQTRKDTLTGPATQTITLTIQLEASDQAWNSLTGVLPPLAALEMMVNPSVSDLLAYELSLGTGKMEAVPPLAPRILFVWGPSRVLPVLIKSLSIKEKMFNSLLTPMLAEADLTLEVYPFAQADDTDIALLMVNLGTVQALSVVNTVEALAGVALQGLT
jgi:hypothetical protein